MCIKWIRSRHFHLECHTKDKNMHEFLWDITQKRVHPVPPKMAERRYTNIGIEKTEMIVTGLHPSYMRAYLFASHSAITVVFFPLVRIRTYDGQERQQTSRTARICLLRSSQKEGLYVQRRRTFAARQLLCCTYRQCSKVRCITTAVRSKVQSDKSPSWISTVISGPSSPRVGLSSLACHNENNIQNSHRY